MSLTHMLCRAALWLPLMALLTLSVSCNRETDSPGSMDIPREEMMVGRHGSWPALPAATRPLNLLLITIDTTRQSRLSCYGYASETTPHLDALAADGVLFEDAVTPAPITLLSHASIMTGLFPYQHGVRNNGAYVLDDRFTTLAEILKERGYETAAVLGGFPLDHRFGLNQGFDHYDDEFPPALPGRASDSAQRPAGEVTRRTLAWLQQAGAGVGGADQPFFLWVHYFDPHYPYEPPQPYDTQFPGRLYDGELAYMDASIGELLQGLRSRGLTESTVILVAGDHGESLGDHRESTHALFVYESTQLVPFILRVPEASGLTGRSWRGRRVEALVDLVDCLPTALHLLGTADADRPMVAGKSLIPVVQGTDPGRRWTYHETLVPRLEFGWSDLRALRVGSWKYIQAPRTELYNLAKDPDELANLADKETKIAAALDASLAELLKLDVGGETGRLTMDQETIEKLRSLGYMAGAETPKGSGPLRDPKDMIVFYEMVNAARNLAEIGRPADAVAVLDSVLVANPDDPSAKLIRASCLLRMGRGAEAILAYDQLLEDCRDCPNLLELQRGRLTAALLAGDLKDAADRADALIRTFPNERGLRLLAAQVAQNKGDLAAARRWCQQEAETFPGDPAPIVYLGSIEAAAGRAQAAEAAYRRALEINPHSGDALAGLAELMITTNRPDVARGYVEQALSENPRNVQALFRKGWFLRKEGRRDDCMRNYLAALQIQPDHVGVLHNLGNIYLEGRDYRKAQEMFERAVATGRAGQDTYLNYGVLHAQQGEPAKAITLWEKAIEVDPRSPQVASIRKNIEMARERLSSAG